MPDQIRVALLDNHPLFRRGIIDAFSDEARRCRRRRPHGKREPACHRAEAGHCRDGDRHAGRWYRAGGADSDDADEW